MTLTNLPQKTLAVVIILLLLYTLPFGVFWWNLRNIKTPLSSDDNPTIIIVLGAGILQNSVPGNILKNRLDKAVEISQNNANNPNPIKHIIVSGDNRKEDYNEPEVMKNYLENNLKNLEPKDKPKIVADYGGLRTIDSCYRARNYFGVKKAYIVSQEFHLPRINFVCKVVGLDATPIAAKNSTMSTTVWGYIREFAASWKSIQEQFYYSPSIKNDGSEVILE
jgi:vancomycin permeability regulator SanA